MNPSLKQFVPSAVCLKCDGCCRFNLSDSPWRPKTGQAESITGIDAQGYLKTIEALGHHQCVHFNPKDNTCGIYLQRPFECSLYPFILSKNSEGIKMYVHLACPYVQEQELKEGFKQYALYLQEFFNQPVHKDFFKTNSRLLHDYSSFKDELKYLFDIGD